MKSLWILFFPLLFGVQLLCAQDFSSFNARVEDYSDAFGGGLNCPQISAADFNNDGVQDIFVFDRVGDVPLVYLRDPQTNELQLEKDYSGNFPALTDWVLLRDYNKDGIQDIFAFSDIPGVSGIVVYRGFYENDQLQFERFDFGPPFNLVQYTSNSGNTIPVFVTRIDIPAFDDVDCDGDMDIITFDPNGGFAQVYQNLSMEQGKPLDSLVFELTDRCWGGFYESGITEEINLAENAGDCFQVNADDLAVNYRHSGSTLLTFDPDADGDLDLVLGDITYNNLNKLTNGGSCGAAWMNKQDVSFPANPAVDLPVFPAAFYVDADNDGTKDLLVAPNAEQGSENVEVLWRYQNTGVDTAAFSLVEKDFLSGNMLDVGTAAFPAFFDYNADGLLDILVGNETYFQREGGTDSRLALLENIGTATAPAYRLVDADYLGMRALNLGSYSFAPAVGDLDGDGDTDLLVGDIRGKLYYYENIAGPGVPVEFAMPEFPYAGIEVGLSGIPAMEDINGDGLTDIVIGERSGFLNYFQNRGVQGAPVFLPNASESPNSRSLGNVNTRIPGGLIGYSAPVFFHESGTLKMLSGSDSGDLMLYDNIGTEGDFQQQNATFSNRYFGTRTRPALADIDADGWYEMLVGNERGGLNLINTTLQAGTVTQVTDPALQLALQLYPNPVSTRLTVNISQSDYSEGEVELLDMLGRRVGGTTLSNATAQLDVSGLSSGVYLLRVYTEGRMASRKVSVQTP